MTTFNRTNTAALEEEDDETVDQEIRMKNVLTDSARNLLDTHLDRF